MKTHNSLLLCARAAATTPWTQKPPFLRRFHYPVRGIVNAYTDVYSYNRMIIDLFKSGSLDSALKVFDEMPERDVSSWNMMISGHYRRGFVKESLNLYNQMLSQCYVEDPSTFPTVVGICGSAGLFREAREVHCRAVVLGYSTDVYIGSALLDLYMRMGCIGNAFRLFSTLEERDLASWNVALRGLCETTGRKASGVTYCDLIRGCGYLRCLEEGMQLHCCVVKEGLVDSDMFVENALMDLYSACESLGETRKVFEAIPPSDVISWDSMVSVCAASGRIQDGLEAFRAMHMLDKKPSARSFLGFLKASSAAKDLAFGQQTHCCILKSGFDSVPVQSALIDMYGNCGDAKCAVSIFDSVPRSLECCNSLMKALLKCDLLKDVIDLFGMMVDERIGFDGGSLSSALAALGGSDGGGTLLHCCAVKSGLEWDVAVACGLIDVYSKSGEVRLSCRVFNQLPSPHVMSYNSVIGALGRNGMGKEGLEMVDLMIRNGHKPDKVTFCNALMGCSNSGLVEEGRRVFQLMQTIHGLKPEKEHYLCMVDLIGGAGLLHDALQMVKDTPWEDDYEIWSSVLKSCRVHKDKQLGSRAANKLIELQPENPSTWLQAWYFNTDVGGFELIDDGGIKEHRQIDDGIIEHRDGQLLPLTESYY